MCAMFRILFVRDLVRLYRLGVLWTLWRLVFLRWGAVLPLGALVGLYLVTAPHTPQVNILSIVLVLLIAYHCFVYLTVRYFTPLYFGRFCYGRLTRIGRLQAYTYYYFLLMPTATEVRVSVFGVAYGGATIGQTYLLLQHPDDPSILLPIFDDNPRFVARQMEMTRPDRWADIATAIDKLRGRPIAGAAR
jgi:hypothetical protein